MIRTLVGYDHVAGPAGTSSSPTSRRRCRRRQTAAGRTPSTSGPACKFGPPVSREVTSKDVLYAFERHRRPEGRRGVRLLLLADRGLRRLRAGRARSISGIATPDASTIVFHLTRPTGDFLYRRRCRRPGRSRSRSRGASRGRPGRYGRDVVSTGPYMIEGADRVDARRAPRSKPMSGFDPLTKLTLVRNPDYDPKTDSPAARESLPDGFVFTSTRTSPTSSTSVARRRPRRRVRARASRRRRSSSTRPIRPGARLHLDSVDRTRLPDDEPDPAAVRRRPRPPGDELDHGQGRAPPGLGRRRRSARSRTTSSPTRCSATSSPRTTRTGRPASAAASRRRSGDARLEVRHAHDGTCGADACHDVLLLADTQAGVPEAAPGRRGRREEDRDHVPCRRRSPAPSRPSRRPRGTSRSRSSPPG